MKFFIDTADLDDIREAMSWGALSGVTTNPSLYAKTGGKLADFEQHMVKICEICEGLPVSAESTATTTQGMVEEGRRLAGLAPNIVVKLPIGACDVYIKVAGGIKIDEPAADLGLCVAMASSFANRLVRPKAIIFGEVGLSGEVRAVSQADVRLKEAAKLGFRAAILPQKNAERLQRVAGIEIFGAATLKDALRLAMPRE